MELTESLYPLQERFDVVAFIVIIVTVICGIITATDLFLFALIYANFYVFEAGRQGTL